MDLTELMASLPKDRLKKMVRAGRQVQECYRLLQKTGANVVGQVLAHQDTFYQWNHYPKGDVFDRETFSQYYYHAHRGAEGEHGHFHTFMRAGGIAPGVEPAPYTGEWQRPMDKDAIAHIIAISMDPKFSYSLVRRQPLGDRRNILPRQRRHQNDRSLQNRSYVSMYGDEHMDRRHGPPVLSANLRFAVSA